MSFSDLAATFSSNTFSRVSAYERPFAAATCRKAFRCSRLFNRHIVPYISCQDQRMSVGCVNECGG